MNRQLSLLVLLLLFSFGSLFSQTYSIDVTIKNIKSIDGYIQIGLYNSPEEFPKVDREFKRYYFKTTASTMKYTLKNLAKGNYAIATYHDKNSDKKCNRNLVGYPTEDFGFSNNVKIFISAPKFEDAKIELNQNQSISISID